MLIKIFLHGPKTLQFSHTMMMIFLRISCICTIEIKGIICKLIKAIKVEYKDEAYKFRQLIYDFNVTWNKYKPVCSTIIKMMHTTLDDISQLIYEFNVKYINKYNPACNTIMIKYVCLAKAALLHQNTHLKIYGVSDWVSLAPCRPHLWLGKKTSTKSKRDTITRKN